MTGAAKVKAVLALLERTGTEAVRKGMARYGLVARRAFGVSMGKLLQMRKQLGVDQPLSLALWKSGWYEARRSPALRRAVTAACTRPAASDERPRIWVGKTTLVELRK